jgi:hypothetical protein
MTWFADLEPCTYFGVDSLVAVGWLEQGHPFPTGPVASEIYTRLVELCKDSWQPWVFAGSHRCDLCLYEGKNGNGNLFVPGDQMVYVCPELVTHYMNAHGYRPPEQFCRAVLSCPPMRSVQYFKALLVGARPLMQAAVQAHEQTTGEARPTDSEEAH